MAFENLQNGQYPVVHQKGSGRPYQDLTGFRFGRLVVIERCGSTPGRGGKPRWLCQCDCGNVVKLPGARLKSGSNKSCGCFRRDRAGQLYRVHGKSKTPEYVMFYDARKRAVAGGVPFTIQPEDIVIPQTCPVLGIELGQGDRESAASLDRKVPTEGYTPENIRVISFRPNRLKSDTSLDELRRILAYCEGDI